MVDEVAGHKCEYDQAGGQAQPSLGLLRDDEGPSQIPKLVIRYEPHRRNTH